MLWWWSLWIASLTFSVLVSVFDVGGSEHSSSSIGIHLAFNQEIHSEHCGQHIASLPNACQSILSFIGYFTELEREFTRTSCSFKGSILLFKKLQQLTENTAKNAHLTSAECLTTLKLSTLPYKRVYCAAWSMPLPYFTQEECENLYSGSFW